MKQNQKGFTLIEIVLVVAIIGIMAAVLGSFLTTGSNSFHSTTRNSNVQKDLQQTMNRIHDLIIDAKNCINIETDASGQTTKLEVFNYKENTSGAPNPDNKNYVGIKSVDVITYDSAQKKLFYQQRIKYVYSTTGGVDEDLDYQNEPSSASLMSENVTSFHVDISELSAKRAVSFSASVEIKEYSSELKDRVSLRNLVLGNKAGYNFEDLVFTEDGGTPSREPAKIEIIDAPDSVLSGTYVQLKWKITGYVLNNDVKWEIVKQPGNDAQGSTIDDNGLLYVSGNGNMVVKVTALGDPASEKASATVRIHIDKQ